MKSLRFVTRYKCIFHFLCVFGDADSIRMGIGKVAIPPLSKDYTNIHSYVLLIYLELTHLSVSHKQ